MNSLIIKHTCKGNPYMFKQRLIDKIIYNRYLYLLLLPVIIYYIIFAYVPMYGTLLAFKEFSYSKGILLSPWVGLKYFRELWVDREFWGVVYNTVIISFGRIIFEFPIPIILALLLNEIRAVRMKKFFQTVFTFPHFLSWVVISGLFINLLSDSGIMNQVIVALGGEKIHLLTEPSTFRALLFITDSWKEAGWGTIIYLATITSISPELYEAAYVDGARRMHMVKYITWPGIRSVMGIMLILAIANVMNAGFDQVFNIYNPGVYNVAEIIDTYIYRKTFMVGTNFSLTTAFGLFKSLVGVILLYTANISVKRINGSGLY